MGTRREWGRRVKDGSGGFGHLIGHVSSLYRTREEAEDGIDADSEVVVRTVSAWETPPPRPAPHPFMPVPGEWNWCVNRDHPICAAPAKDQFGYDGHCRRAPADPIHVTAHGLSDPAGVTDCCHRAPGDLPPGDVVRTAEAPGWVTCAGAQG